MSECGRTTTALCKPLSERAGPYTSSLGEEWDLTDARIDGAYADGVQQGLAFAAQGAFGLAKECINKRRSASLQARAKYTAPSAEQVGGKRK